MAERIEHFLLVFDHEQGRLIETLKFGQDADAAVAAYTAKEADTATRSSSRWSSSVPTPSRR